MKSGWGGTSRVGVGRSKGAVFLISPLLSLKEVMLNAQVLSSNFPMETRILSKPIRRRNRLIKSCLECRRRKLKCNRTQPCDGCRATSVICVYISVANPKVPKNVHGQSDHAVAFEHFERAGDVTMGHDHDLPLTLPCAIGGHIDSHKGTNELSGMVLQTGASSPSSGDPNDDRYLEPTPLAVQDAAYAAGVDADIDDIGIRVGMLRLGERIGGLYRPRMDEEISTTLQHLDSSNKQLYERNTAFSMVPAIVGDDLKPRHSFTPSTPSIGLMMGPLPETRSKPTNFLPPRATCDNLLRQYWIAVHPVARILHRPTFALQYESLWECLEEAHENALKIPAYLSAIVYCVLFSAAVSMDDEQVRKKCECDRFQLVSGLQLATETALRQAQLLISTRLETLQAFIAYMLATCLEEVSRAHSALVGMAVRIAECMGLHRDPTEYDGFTAAECHIRRLIWYQICFLDLRTSEIQGPRPFILRDGYTTRLPLEVKTGVTAWQELVLSMIRFECQEMHRKCLELRTQVDEKRLGLTNVIAQVEEFNTMMHRKYGVALGDGGGEQQPIQRMAGLVLKMMVSLLYIYLLHRYMSGVAYRMPERTRQLALQKGTECLEASVELDSAPEFQPWAWYNRSYHEYHIAFLLLYKVLMFPTRKEATRIWRCLDIIFAEPLAKLQLSNFANTATATFSQVIQKRKIKGRYLLCLIRHELRVYRARKGLKMPSSFEESMITSLGPRKGKHREDAGALGPDVGALAEATDSFTSPHTLPTPETTVSSLDPTLTTESSDDMLAMLPPNDMGGSDNGNWSSEPSSVMDAEMLEIDWDLWDSLFPPHINDGVLDMEGLE
ncbi:hypothetical protein BJY04DRAFT_116565 [Aspergillus karnatakaensis]|uniref:Zn(II)2Cys6 transcription factor n=1 Tax=Aspergillus karnatakaensis TaxID=1810916 RepID=UPI003CCDFED8